MCVCVCPWVKWPLGFPLCWPHAPLHSPFLRPSFLPHLAALPWPPMLFLSALASCIVLNGHIIQAFPSLGFGAPCGVSAAESGTPTGKTKQMQSGIHNIFIQIHFSTLNWKCIFHSRDSTSAHLINNFKYSAQIILCQSHILWHLCVRR